MPDVWCSLTKSNFVVLKETRPLKTFFVLKAPLLQMLSDGYWAAVGTSNSLNLG